MAATTTYRCTDCDTILVNPSHECPKCGSHMQNISVNISDSVGITQMLGADVKEDGFHEFSQHIQSGDRIGKNGKLAHIELSIDKKKGVKHHLVLERGDDGNWNNCARGKCAT